MEDSSNRSMKIPFVWNAPTCDRCGHQRWTFSRLRESSVAHVGKRELSPMSRLRRNHDMSCLETGHLASNVLVV